MRINARVVLSTVLTLVVMLGLVAVPWPSLASDPNSDEPLDQIAVDDPQAVGWRLVDDSTARSTGPERVLGLAWDSESILEFRGNDQTAGVRLNCGPVIPGDTIIEYLLCLCAPYGSPVDCIYGQVSYAGWDMAGLRLSERYCSVPVMTRQACAMDSVSEINWFHLRKLIDTSGAVRTSTYAFPLEHQSIAFGPTGHLGLSLAVRATSEAGAVVEPQLAGAVGMEIATDSHEEIQPAELTIQPEVDDEESGPPGDNVVEDAETGPEEETGTTPSPFSAPESTARFFLEAVMVDKDASRAARAWSSRIPEVVTRAVVRNEIEFFSDRGSGVLQSLLSSLTYTTEPASDGEVIVSVVEHGEEAIVGRLELVDGEWLFIALAYQLDIDLNLSPEWKRLAGLE